MSASPGPSGSVPPMLGFTVDDFWDALGDSPASSAAETWLQNLQAGGEMPTPQELIGLLSALLQERAPIKLNFVCAKSQTPRCSLLTLR